jgi:hypothetical protein
MAISTDHDNWQRIAMTSMFTKFRIGATPPPNSVSDRLAGNRKENATYSAVQLTLLVLLFASGAVAESMRLNSVGADVWMHLRTGLWILQEHSIPRTGLFSQSPELPWTDLHWMYEAFLASAYKFLGLRAIPFVSMLVKMLLAVCTFRLARCGKAPFSASIIIAGLAVLVMDRCSVLSSLSAVFFAIELCMIARFRKEANWRSFWPFIALIALWSNVDSGFIFGVLCVALFAGTSFLEVLGRLVAGARVQKAIPASMPFALAAATAAATLVSPYLFGVWKEGWVELYGRTAIKHFTEMQPMAFRTPMDFVALLFVMGSMTVLGLRRRSDLFQLSAIGIAMAAAFRFPRDFWLPVLCCVAALADALGNQEQATTTPSGSPLTSKQCILSATIAGVALVLAMLSVPGDLKSLVTQAQARLPIASCDAIRSAHLLPPIFQSYEWGGFLAWYLPEQPVVIDGRVGLYGVERNKKFFDVVEGKARAEENEDFAKANTVLLVKNSALGKALLDLPQLSGQFRVVYQDDLAIVFVRN